MLIWISLSYATFGIVIDNNGKIIETAPIAKWMLNKNFKEIQWWLKKKNAIVKNLTSKER